MLNIPNISARGKLMKHANNVKVKAKPSSKKDGYSVFALILLMLSVAALVLWWMSSKSWMLVTSALVFGAGLFGVGLFIKHHNKRFGIFICVLALVLGLVCVLDAVLPSQENQYEYVSSDPLVVTMLTKESKTVHRLSTPGIIPDNVMNGNSLRIKTTPIFGKVVSSSTPIAVIA